VRRTRPGPEASSASSSTRYGLDALADRHRRTGAGRRPAVRTGHRVGRRVRTTGASRPAEVPMSTPDRACSPRFCRAANRRRCVTGTHGRVTRAERRSGRSPVRMRHRSGLRPWRWTFVADRRHAVAIFSWKARSAAAPTVLSCSPLPPLTRADWLRRQPRMLSALASAGGSVVGVGVHSSSSAVAAISFIVSAGSSACSWIRSKVSVQRRMSVTLSR
jgi:hypothetical protein